MRGLTRVGRGALHLAPVPERLAGVLVRAVGRGGEVEEHGDTAIEMGRFTLFAEDGSQLDGGKYLVIWKVEDGAVKLHRDIWTSSRPAA